MAIRGVCEFCGHEVTSAHTPAYPVTGWEAGRGGKGGANRIIARKRVPDRVAHLHCVENEDRRGRLGINAGQGTLT